MPRVQIEYIHHHERWPWLVDTGDRWWCMACGREDFYMRWQRKNAGEKAVRRFIYRHHRCGHLI